MVEVNFDVEIVASKNEEEQIEKSLMQFVGGGTNLSFFSETTVFVKKLVCWG